MSIWAEAFDLPHLADPGKKIAWLPTLDYSFGRHADAFREEGSLSIPTAYSRINELHYVDPDDHSNDVGSVIHFFQRGVLGADEKPRVVSSFVTERHPKDLKSGATGVTQISGRGLTSYFLDRLRLTAFDHPDNPTRQSEWNFGGENLLSNPGFEESPTTPKSIEIIITATGGTYTLSDGTDTTSAIAFDAPASEVSARIETDLGGFTDIVLAQSSASPRTFVMTMIDPPFGVNLFLDDANLTGGEGTATTTEEGGLTPGAWTKARPLVAGLPSNTGFYDQFAVSTAQARTGVNSLAVNPGPFNATSNRLGGAQQVMRVTPGSLAQASVWIYPTSGQDQFRLGLFSVGEEYIAASEWAGETLTPDTWNEISIADVQVPDNVDQLIFRVACTNLVPTNPSLFFIDDAEYYEGLPAATIGAIWDLVIGSRAPYLVPTFNATTDSNSEAWDADRSVALTEGDTWGQIAESFQQLWGYVHRVRYDREDNTYYYDIFNPGYVEVDHSSTDTGSLIVGMNILGGEVVSRSPEATNFRVVGEGGFWAEDDDANLVGPWGEADAFLNDKSIRNASNLVDAINRIQAQNLDQMITFQAGMTAHGQFQPLQDFDVFHKVSVELGGKSPIPRGDRVVTSIVVSGSPGKAPDYQVYVNSDAFASTGAAALAEAVRRLLRKRKDRVEPIRPDLGGGAGGKGMVHVVIISDSEPEEIQEKGDFIVPSSNSSALLQAAFDALPGGSWSIWLAGQFDLDADVTAPSGSWIRGLGYTSVGYGQT